MRLVASCISSSHVADFWALQTYLCAGVGDAEIRGEISYVERGNRGTLILMNLQLWRIWSSFFLGGSWSHTF